MKGLIIKDAFSIVKQNEIFIIMILLINAVFMTFLDDLSFLSVITMFFTTILILKQMADEDKNGYSDYQNTMPVTAREIVLSRYLFGFGFALAGALASIFTEFIVSFMFDIPLDILARIRTTSIFAGVSFVLLTLLLPLIYKFGTKAVGLINILILLIPTLLNFFFEDRISTFDLGASPAFVLIVSAAASLVIICVSILLSLKIVTKKQAA